MRFQRRWISGPSLNNNQQIRPKQMNKQSTALQLIDGGRFTAAHAALARARVREEVVEDRRRGERLQAIAKRRKIGYNDVLTLVEEAGAERVRAARQDGFRDGLCAARMAPATSPRRAA